MLCTYVQMIYVIIAINIYRLLLLSTIDIILNLSLYIMNADIYLSV